MDFVSNDLAVMTAIPWSLGLITAALAFVLIIIQVEGESKDMRISAADFLLATDPNLASYTGDSTDSAIKRLLGEEKLAEVQKEKVAEVQKEKIAEVRKEKAPLSKVEIINRAESAGETSDDEEEVKTQGPIVDPFSMSSGNVKFYGGLLTFGHELHPARICRVLNACIRSDGTVVLPAWMRRYDEMLSFDCGIKRLEFSLTDTNPPPPLHNLDLFGSEVPPPELHLFLEHFAPQLVALDMLGGERDLTQACHSRMGKGCFGFPLETSIRPAVLIHPDIDAQGAKTSWIKQFLRLIPVENYKHRVRSLSRNELFSMQSDDEVQCFRSAVLTRSPRTKYSINPEMLRDLTLFKRANITKTPNQVWRMTTRKKCFINIMFINRKKPLANATLPGVVGFIPNIWRLRREIKARALRFKRQGLRVNVSAVSLDNKRLRYQINAMQKSDIVISGSTGHLANMLFLKENSTIIELMSFGYYPKHYEKMARYTASGIYYDQYIAHPDYKWFKNCINTVVPIGSANFTKAKRVLRRFKKVANNFLISDNTHSYTLHNLKKDLDFAKPCARAQRLNSNATLFATAIIRHARLRCGIALELEDQ